MRNKMVPGWVFRHSVVRRGALRHQASSTCGVLGGAFVAATLLVRSQILTFCPGRHQVSWRLAPVSQSRSLHFPRNARKSGTEFLAEDVQIPRVGADVIDEVAEAAQYMVEKSKNTIVSLQGQLRPEEEADDLSNKGYALQTLPKNKWYNGMKEVQVPDYSQLDENGSPLMMTVELDRKKDFQGNAKLCFKKARKIKRANEMVGPMVQDLEVAIEDWSADAATAQKLKLEFEERGELCSASEQKVHRLYTKMVEKGAIKQPEVLASPPDPKEEAKKALKKKYGKDIDCYRSPAGHEVIAGRSSKMNEYISLKLAKGNMVWFHTDRGIPGSHVLIRADWDTVADEDIEFAAKIAAYHSKAKQDFHAPVMYCKGHQVRKIKGTPTGTVSISGSTYSIIVSPGLPEDD